MLLNPYQHQRAMMLQRRRKMMETAKSLVPVHSYNPVSINLQDPLFRKDSEEIKVVPLEKKEYVFLDSSSDNESSDDDDNTLNEEPEIVEKDDDVETNEIKIISIDKENLQVKDNELGEAGEEPVEEPVEVKEEEPVEESDKGLQKEIIQEGGNLIKNVIVSFF